MLKGSIFIKNNTQAVELPDEARFPDGVTHVMVQVVGNDRILTPIEHSWDSFFLSDECVTDDFMNVRASQNQSEREDV